MITFVKSVHSLQLHINSITTGKIETKFTQQQLNNRVYKIYVVPQCHYASFQVKFIEMSVS